MRFVRTVLPLVAAFLTAPATAAPVIHLHHGGPTIYYQYGVRIDEGVYGTGYNESFVSTNRQFSHVDASQFFSCSSICRDWTLTDKSDHVELMVGDALLSFVGPIFADAGSSSEGKTINSLPIGSFGSTSSGIFRYDVSQVGGVPEAATWVLVIFGFAIVAGSVRRQASQQYNFRLA